MSDERGYNGWKNYETWVTALWIDNDQGTHEYARELRDDAVIRAETTASTYYGREPRGILADFLRDWITEMSPLADDASLFSDLLGAALEEVDWYEIAENYLGEIEPSHAPRPNPDAMPGGVFTTCAECSGTVWREDSPGDGYTSLDEGIWRHTDGEQMAS